MRKQIGTKTITAIVPAYNEAGRIGTVLSVLCSYPRFKEVIVVDDGSTDNTAAVVAKFPHARCIQLHHNYGKGEALDRGVRETTTDLIFFCDADITGLTHRILEQIMRPVLKRTVGMSIAIQNRRAYFLNYLFVTKVLRLVPVLAGQRVLSKALWSKLPRWYKQNFRIEVGLNFYSKFYANGYQYRAFSELGQTVKERKYGLVRGLAHRLAMTFDIMAAQIKLYALEVPQTIKARRIAFFGALGNAVGALVGAALIWIARIGPLAALHQFFAHRLAEGHTIYFVDFLTRSATVASKELIASIGIAIVLLNVLGLIINIRRVVSLIRARR